MVVHMTCDFEATVATLVRPLEQNELFDTEDDNILDFTERNPFGDAGD